MPNSGSWQDLKDHMREAGDVCYADVYKDGSGVVEFLRYDDMKYAVRKLDDSRFRSHEVCWAIFNYYFVTNLKNKIYYYNNLYINICMFLNIFKFINVDIYY